MRRKSLALLSAALLFGVPLVAAAQQGQPSQPRPGSAARPTATRPAPVIPLSGRYLAARVAEEDHDYDRAADEIDRALALAPDDPDVVYSAFRMRMYAGRLEQAAELAPQVLTRRPGDAVANLVLAVQAIRKGDYRAADASLGRIGADNQLGPLRESMRLWLKAGDKDYAAARAILGKLRGAGGSELAAVITEAQIDEMAGDKAGADAKYRKALSLDRNGNLRTLISIADGLRRVGKPDEAAELLKGATSKFNDTILLDALLGPKAATPKPPSAASGVSDILFEIGSAFASDPRAQRTDLALIFYQLAAALRPENDYAWLLMAGLFEQFDTVPKAIAALEKIGPDSPLYWQARLQIAALDSKQEQFDQAVDRLKAMVAEKPERIDAALVLADLLRGKERFAEAVQAYDTVLQRLGKAEERHWSIYFGRGIAYERLKQWPKAEQDMKKALELSPEQPHVLNYLGYSWIDQGMHLDEGMKMLERATELRPDDGAITDSVGWAFYRLGQFDKAVEWLERAIVQKSDDPTISEHLGDAYWHVGRLREARFQWERALNQKPDKDRVAVIKDKLANGLSAANDKPTVYEKAADKQGG